MTTTEKFNKLKAGVMGMLMEKVEDIFIDLQNEMNIKTGDITPLDALEVEKREEQLATIIADILIAQKGN